VSDGSAERKKVTSVLFLCFCGVVVVVVVVVLSEFLGTVSKQEYICFLLN
jgi:hypothetical protein